MATPGRPGWKHIYFSPSHLSQLHQHQIELQQQALQQQILQQQKLHQEQLEFQERLLREQQRILEQPQQQPLNLATTHQDDSNQSVSVVNL